MTSGNEHVPGVRPGLLTPLVQAFAELPAPIQLVIVASAGLRAMRAKAGIQEPDRERAPS